MATKAHVFQYPWDFVINEIFKAYGSKEFYKKFKDGWYKFSQEITQEWQSVYMNWVGICHQEEFFNNIDKWKKKYTKLYPDDTIWYEVVVAYILPLAAPLFFEQDNTPVNY